MAIKILNDLLPVAEQTEVGVVKPDNVSITVTQDGELQSVVVDLPEEVVTSDNYVNAKLWKGTLEEYNAIETKDPLVTYIVTDDNVETLKTTDYNRLDNKPSIENITLEGNKTLEELNIQSADTAITTSNITNCITKIPQNIKLEINDGALTIKAGSKVYIPNGFEEDGTTRKFDEIILDKDYNRSTTTTSTGYTLLYFNKNNQDDNYKLSLVTVTGDATRWSYSCDTPPVEFVSDIAYWYDTKNNLVKNTINSGSVWSEGYSLPIAIVSYTLNAFISIDQVFNGFGYIGSTIFALPDVEGLIPNGRNEDGSLNNIIYKINSLLTYNTTTANKDFAIFIDGITNSLICPAISTIGKGKRRIFNEKENIWILDGSKYSYLDCGKYIANELTPYNIIYFNPKNTFQVIDRNDTEWASSASKPSDRYIQLTVGASNSTYKAPANGYVFVVQDNEADGHLNVYSKTIGSMVNIKANSAGKVYLPIKKDETFQYEYSGRNATGQNNLFFFVYDEGVQ